MQWDHEVDLLVAGSGNGAMTAAICAYDMGVGDVLVIEKAEKYGGSSALSGGGVWVPGNRYAKAAGAKDSYEEALSYLQHAIPEDLSSKEMLSTYLTNAPKMVDFLHNNSRVRYQSLEKYPDYFSDQPGAKIGHRSMEPEPINLSELGNEETMILGGGTMYMFYKFAITQVEAQVLVGRLKGWIGTSAKVILKYYLDIPWLLRGYGFSRRTTGGGAGIVRLRLSMKDRNIPLWLNTPLEELIIESGKIIGVVVSRDGKPFRIKTRNAVMLATGGFEHNQKMREQYLPKPTNTEWSAGCRTNTGDGIKAGQAVGADTRLMENAWWCTTKCIPGNNYPFLSIITKSLPGSIVVNQRGKRFSNESQNYMSFLKETFKQHSDEKPCVPCFIIFDSNFRKNYSVYPILIPNMFLPQRYYDEGFLGKADTIKELAENMGIDPLGLQQTIDNFNEYANTGKDIDFKRGDAAYDRYYGDPDVKPNPCLGPILRPPFYTIRIQPGDFGTQGGLTINTDAQVLNEEGEVIEGLYACGNSSAAVLPTYPGPGSTLGPAMTFAYQAAKKMTGFKEL